MTELRDLFEEAANSAPPPSRLVADELYAAGRRRRRRRAVANSAVAVALVMTAGTGIASMMRQEPSVSAEAGVLPHRGERIQWAGAADAQHLYVTMSTQLSCTKEPCNKTIVQLVGSDDGGRTWSDRGGPIDAARFTVLGPGRLLAAVLPDSPSTGAPMLQVSTDGGRIWRNLARASAVAEVPTGGTAVCWPESDKVAECTVYALDAVSHRIAPLTSQPPFPLYVDADSSIAQSAGLLWAAGVDPATGRPAVAVSRDSGRSWTSKVFADTPACPGGPCGAPYLAVGDGPAGYAVVDVEGHFAVYRYVENGGQGGGGWQRVPAADDVPAVRRTGGKRSFVTSDGTHVLAEVVAEPGRDIDGYRWWAARPDGAYQPVELDGLPATVYPIRRTPDGWFYTHSFTDGMLYGSADGWHWSPVARSS